MTHSRAILNVLDPQERSPGAARCQFAVSHLLQTHSLNNDPSDRKTQVWGCEFEPDPERKGLFGQCDLKIRPHLQLFISFIATVKPPEDDHSYIVNELAMIGLLVAYKSWTMKGIHYTRNRPRSDTTF